MITIIYYMGDCENNIINIGNMFVREKYELLCAATRQSIKHIIVVTGDNIEKS